MDKKSLWERSSTLADVFIESFKTPPREIVLDFDATDDRVHGNQEKRFYHGYYGCYCFLPLYVFCGDHLLAAYLRPSKIDGAKHAEGILKLLVKHISLAWPEMKIIYRGDSGFCRWRTMRWCDNNDVGHILGLPKNNRINELSVQLREEARTKFEQTGVKQKFFGQVQYGAGTWDRERRVIVKAEHLSKGANPRYVVTNISGDPAEIYKKYCARGKMENRIKEQQLYLFADRTSWSKWLRNQFRLLLSAGHTRCSMQFLPSACPARSWPELDAIQFV